jgi:hypothetical protein
MITPDQIGQEPLRRRGGGCRRLLLIGAGGLAALIVIIIAVAVATGGSEPAKITTSPGTPAVTAPATRAPVATPSPDGTFRGSCDYTLGDSPATGTAAAIGDIDATNTGNVGIVVRLTITWPQEGYPPLSMSKTVRLTYGGEQDTQFHRPLSYDEITRLQSYQTGHDYADGCTYHGVVTGTFGAVSA